MTAFTTIALRGLLLAALAVGALATSGARAEETRTGELGGPGGSPFTERCGAGEYLVGLRGRSGNYLDAIAPICAPWRAEARAFGGVRFGLLRGGNGGSPGDVICDNGAAVTGFVGEGADNRQRTVGLLSPRCNRALGPYTDARKASTLQYFGTSAADRAPQDPGLGSSAVPFYSTIACPRGALAVGIFGGYGSLVDRFGLICDSAPDNVSAPRRVTGLGKRPASAPAPARDVAAASASGGVAPAPSRAQTEVGDMSRVTPERHRPATPAPGTCKSGYVWRGARDGDGVCVTPGSRQRVQQENASAASRVDPNGAWGPASCLPGFVWREAFDGDTVCVAPSIRDRVREENATAASRTN
jgi:hypothetical protein